DSFAADGHIPQVQFAENVAFERWMHDDIQSYLMENENDKALPPQPKEAQQSPNGLALKAQSTNDTTAKPQGVTSFKKFQNLFAQSPLQTSSNAPAAGTAAPSTPNTGNMLKDGPPLVPSKSNVIWPKGPRALGDMPKATAPAENTSNRPPPVPPPTPNSVLGATAQPASAPPEHRQMPQSVKRL
ncbi:MAG: hypothetical protein ACXWIN_08080, partial [Burkholderiaceae bacterium]